MTQQLTNFQDIGQTYLCDFQLPNFGLFCRVQNSINEEQKKEIQILQRRLGNLRQEFQDQVAGTASSEWLIPDPDPTWQVIPDPDLDLDMDPAPDPTQKTSVTKWKIENCMFMELVCSGTLQLSNFFLTGESWSRIRNLIRIRKS